MYIPNNAKYDPSYHMLTLPLISVLVPQSPPGTYPQIPLCKYKIKVIEGDHELNYCGGGQADVLVIAHWQVLARIQP